MAQRNLPGVTDEKNEKLSTVQPVLGPTLEPRLSVYEASVLTTRLRRSINS